MELAPRPAPAPHRASVLGVAIGCLLIGGVAGFLLGVSSVKTARDVPVDSTDVEQQATTAAPVTVDRPTFQFQHPGNWKIDTSDADYNADHAFSIDSPGHSFEMFQIVDAAVDPQVLVDKQLETQTARVMKDAARRPLTQWGKHNGVGYLMTGRMLGAVPGTIRVFAFREGGQTFNLVESTYDEDRSGVQPGFDLIERTFEVKPAAK